MGMLALSFFLLIGMTNGCLNDPATIRRVLWGYGNKWYLDSDCEYEF